MKNNLPNTSFAVLGILATGSAMSGYAVRKSAENLRYFYWSPAQSQIYSELRRLAKLNFVTSEYIAQQGKPNKRLYRITPTGKTTFVQWLNHKPVDPTMMKHAMQLRLFFGDSAEPAHLATQLRQFIADAEAALAHLAIVSEYSEIDPAYKWSSLVAQWSEAHYQTEVTFARKILEKIVAE